MGQKLYGLTKPTNAYPQYCRPTTVRWHPVERELVGVAEIAKMFGVSRQRINAITKTHADFPKPVAELMAGRIWNHEEIEAWRRDHRASDHAAV